MAKKIIQIVKVSAFYVLYFPYKIYIKYKNRGQKKKDYLY